MKSILLAPNAFKESASSVEITEHLKTFIKNKLPNYEIISAPISDGGDDFYLIINSKFNCKTLSTKVSNCHNDKLKEINFLYEEKSKTVFVESADIFGLKTVPKEFRNPLVNSSKGLGEFLLYLCEKNKQDFNIENVIIGLGGTAINDLGMGALSKLGLIFYDKSRNVLEPFPENFIKINSYKNEKVKLPFNFSFVVDVDNPLLGINGTSRKFAAQKGADENQIILLEEGFNNLLKIFYGNSLAGYDKKLKGAGGGVAAGFQIFYNAEIISSEKFILEILQLNKLIEKSDVIVTGEGKFDSQSLLKKGTGVIINKSLELNKKVFLICGSSEITNEFIENPDIEIFDFSKIYKTKEESIKNYKPALEKSGARLIDLLQTKWK